MDIFEPKKWLGFHEQQIMIRMSSLKFKYHSDSRMDHINPIPTTQYSITFIPPNNSLFSIAVISFYNGVAISVTFGGEKYGSIYSWLEKNSTKVENPTFQIRDDDENVERILRKDNKYWYNIRLSKIDSHYGITITSRKMFP